MPKTVIRYLSYFFIIFLLFVTISPKTYAQLNVCNPPQTVFQRIQDSFQRNIRETAINHVTSVLLDWTFNTATGSEMSEYMGCTDYIATQLQAANPGDPDVASVVSDLQTYNCGDTDEAVCQSIMNRFDTGHPAEGGTNIYNRQKFAEGKVAGSLLGMGYYVENEMKYEPVPVNMAYFFRDYTKRIPVIGEKAYAADISYEQPFLDQILEIWKITRNAAYAIMAVIMLYVGITIILRKQVNQKVVVTVQYSLPKIVLSLILIAFSYPIGALMTSLAWSLFNSAGRIIATLGAASGSAFNIDSIDGMFQSVGAVMLPILVIIFQAGIGIGMVALVVIVVIISFGLYLFAVFKAFYLYIKMLVGVVTAPIEFAMGAIPGNEDRIAAWFKRMTALGLGIFGIAATIKLVHLMALTAVVSILQTNRLAGALFGVFGGLFLFVFGYTFALTVPGQIDKALNGKKR
jgi:hypothetical protein